MYKSYQGSTENLVIMGGVGVSYADVTDSLAVRPVINLVSDVITVSGDGSSSHPYVVN